MIEYFFNQSANVMKCDTDATSGSGVKRTWSVRVSGLACRIANRRPFEQLIGGKVVTVRKFRLYCAATAATKAIEESDRVVCEGITYEVSGIANPGSLDHHLEIDLFGVD